MAKANNLIESDPVELALRITDPSYTPNKAAVTFALSFSKPGGPEMASIPGWRVWKGAVVPPSTRKRDGSYFPTVGLDPVIVEVLNQMVQEWKKDFPLVRFPSVEEKDV